MKKLLSLFIFVLSLLFLSACSNSQVEEGPINPERTFVGTWVLRYETTKSPNIDRENPYTNKIITLTEEGRIQENYANLSGLDQGCVSEGNINGKYIKEADNRIVFSKEEVEIVTYDKIICPDTQRTGGAPKPILYFGYEGDLKWSGKLDAQGDTLTIEIGSDSDDTPKITQVYEKQSVGITPTVQN